MLIPYNTDAPLYHPPIATVATIILNVLLFVPVFLHEDPYALEMEGFSSENVDWDEAPMDEADFDEDVDLVDENGNPLDEATQQEYRKAFEEIKKKASDRKQEAPAPGGTTIWRLSTLEFGKFRPWQWLTANYMHIDLFHLIGNMFVLWGFGLVVEGKVGWWRFLVIYNLMGILGWGFVQMIMLFASEGIGLGASLAIFGLVVISLVWAPANDMQCVFMFGLRPILFESSIMTIAIGSVFLQIAISALHILTLTNMGMGLRITSEILHLIGAALGFGVGVAMLKKNWVDCENWDMFSVWAGKNTKTMEEDRQNVSEQLERIKKQEQKRLAGSQPAQIAPLVPANQQEVLQTQFRNLVAAGKPIEAWSIFCRGERECLGWQIPEPDFISYVGALRKQQLWDHAVGAMQEYLQRYTERETTVRMAMAQILLQQLNRPRDAWQALSEVNGALLSPQEKTTYDKLRLGCKQRAAAIKAASAKKPE
jgi:membrane associated rhomboid family serine protease